MNKRMISRLLAITIMTALIFSTYAGPASALGSGAGIEFLPRSTFNLEYAGGSIYTGSLPAAEEYGKGEIVTASRQITMGGYLFTGWKYNGPSTTFQSGAPLTDGKVISAEARFIMPEGDVTLTAQWVKMHMVTFLRNDGSINSTYRTLFVAPGGKIGDDMPGGPSRPGYYFIGWSLERNKGANESNKIANMIITEDIIVFAQWGLIEEPIDTGEPPVETEEPPVETEEPPVESKEPPPEPSPTPTPKPTQRPQEPDPEPYERPTPAPIVTPSPRPNPEPTPEPDPEPDPDPDPEPIVYPGAMSPPPPPPSTSNPTEQQPDQKVYPEVNEIVPEAATHQPRGDLEEIINSGVPLIGFGNMGVPLFAPPGAHAWALLNLILALLGLLYAVVNILRAVFRKRKEQKEDGNSLEQLKFDNMGAEEDREDRRLRPVWLTVSIAMGIIGILLFILTQDMTQAMVLVDYWTLAHAIIFAVELVAVIFIFKRKDKNDDDWKPGQHTPPSPPDEHPALRTPRT